MDWERDDDRARSTTHDIKVKDVNIGVERTILKPEEVKRANGAAHTIRTFIFEMLFERKNKASLAELEDKEITKLLNVELKNKLGDIIPEGIQRDMGKLIKDLDVVSFEIMVMKDKNGHIMKTSAQKDIYAMVELRIPIPCEAEGGLTALRMVFVRGADEDKAKDKGPRLTSKIWRVQWHVNPDKQACLKYAVENEKVPLVQKMLDYVGSKPAPLGLAEILAKMKDDNKGIMPVFT